jgi:hypothetical protein
MEILPSGVRDFPILYSLRCNRVRFYFSLNTFVLFELGYHDAWIYNIYSFVYNLFQGELNFGMGSGALILYDFTREDHGMYTINNIFLCCSRVMEPELVKIGFFFITC